MSCHGNSQKERWRETIHMLSLLPTSITTRCVLSISKSKIFPFLEYGNIVLNACTEAELAKLQRWKTGV